MKTEMHKSFSHSLPKFPQHILCARATMTYKLEGKTNRKQINRWTNKWEFLSVGGTLNNTKGWCDIEFREGISEVLFGLTPEGQETSPGNLGVESHGQKNDKSKHSALMWVRAWRNRKKPGITETQWTREAMVRGNGRGRGTQITKGSQWRI